MITNQCRKVLKYLKRMLYIDQIDQSSHVLPDESQLSSRIKGLLDGLPDM